MTEVPYGAGSTWIAGTIDIEALRNFRQTAQWDNWMKDLTTEQYQLIYEQPIYPKNLYLERAPYTHAEYREQVTRKQVELLQERGVWARPGRPAPTSADRMAGWDDVRRIALGLPETSERTSHGNASWRVRDKLFVWERPLRLADLRALGDGAPTGAILGARVEHVGAKEALLADDPASTSRRRTSTATRRSSSASTRSAPRISRR